MNKKIKWMYQMLESLPKDDFELCKKFLDKRQFVELKELIDSNAILVSKQLTKLAPTDDKMLSKRYLDLETTYNNIKALQSEVDIQAAAFMDEENYKDYDC